MRTSELLTPDMIKRLADQGRVMDEGWIAYRASVLPSHAGAIQVAETRLAFFAGAQFLFAACFAMMDDGDTPSAADMQRIAAVSAELDAFARGCLGIKPQ